MKDFLVRCFIAVKLIANKRKEPFLSFSGLLQYLLKGGYFPGNKNKNFDEQIRLEKTTNGYTKLIFNNQSFYYPSSYSDEFIKLNFSAILNEQGVGTTESTPHQYLKENEISENAVIFDLGAAEGFQSKIWAGITSRKVIIFEPDENLVGCLERTFEEEIKDGRVQVIPYGVSDSPKIVSHFGSSFKLDSLGNLIKKYSLPFPNYIKVDIEGQEMNFLTGASEVLKNLGNSDIIQIAVYHHPDDYIKIPEFLKKFSGKGFMSEGFVCYNRDTPEIGSYKNLFHPLFRKCIYTFSFRNN